MSKKKKEPVKVTMEVIIAVGLLPDGEIIAVKEGPPLTISYTTNDKVLWHDVLVGREDEFILNSNCFLNGKKRIFLATNLGRIYRSENLGRSWVVVEAGVHFNKPYYMIHKSRGVIFVITEDGSIISRDKGNTWGFLQLLPFEHVRIGETDGY